MSAQKKNITAELTLEAKPASFEAAYAELEALVAEMESGDMALDASLNAYKRGNFLLQFCQQALSEVEQAVHILNAKNTLDSFTAIDD